MDEVLFKEILDETAELVRRSAHPRRRTIVVSPEVAQLLERPVTGTLRAPSPPEDNAAPRADGRYAERAAYEDDETVRALAELAREVSVCTKCPLHKGRQQTVFADGNPHAELVFVGEAPGEHEDLQGLPFVGRAGQLLTDIIVKGMKLRREDVYICNAIKCRPPKNRDPLPDEKASCKPYLVRQLDLVKPKVICALGGHAAKTLLEIEESTGRLRGRWHFYRGIPLRVTYHPGYLLRNPADKAKTWKDIQEVMKLLRGEVTPAPPAAPLAPDAGLFEA